LWTYGHTVTFKFGKPLLSLTNVSAHHLLPRRWRFHNDTANVYVDAYMRSVQTAGYPTTCPGAACLACRRRGRHSGLENLRQRFLRRELTDCSYLALDSGKAAPSMLAPYLPHPYEYLWLHTPLPASKPPSLLPLLPDLYSVSFIVVPYSISTHFFSCTSANSRVHCKRCCSFPSFLLGLCTTACAQPQRLPPTPLGWEHI